MFMSETRINCRLTTNLSKSEFGALALRYSKGEVSSDEYSRMTPALRKKLDRFVKKSRKSNKK